MLFSQAIDNIMIDLGNRTASGVRDRVKRAIQRAQQDLEAGKTPPKFLLVEDAPLVLLSGTSTIALPTNFWRMETKPHFVATDTSAAKFLSPKFDVETAFAAHNASPAAPSVFIIRQSVLDFITLADQNYDLVWSYYKHATPLAGEGDSNEWLSETGTQSDWLCGEAGYRVANSIRDQQAIPIFDKMRTQGRAGVFGETLAQEADSGPIIMGADL